MPSADTAHQRTDSRLREIAARAPGTVGFSVVHLSTGESFSFNDQHIFPQASAIKIPLLMEVYKQAGAGKFHFTDTHRLKKSEHTPGSGILRELGDATVEMSLHDLAVLMILVSDNTATNLFIDLVGLDNVNQTLQSLGLEHTRLRRRMMDLDAIEQGRENTSTPAEAARIMQMLYRGEFLNRAVCDEILKILAKPKPSAIRSGLPENIPIVGKPGAINGVATEWAIVLLENQPYILCAMETHNPREETSPTIKALSTELHQYFSNLTPPRVSGITNTEFSPSRDPSAPSPHPMG